MQQRPFTFILLLLSQSIASLFFLVAIVCNQLIMMLDINGIFSFAWWTNVDIYAFSYIMVEILFTLFHFLFVSHVLLTLKERKSTHYKMAKCFIISMCMMLILAASIFNTGLGLFLSNFLILIGLIFAGVVVIYSIAMKRPDSLFFAVGWLSVAIPAVMLLVHLAGLIELGDTRSYIMLGDLVECLIFFVLLTKYLLRKLKNGLLYKERLLIFDQFMRSLQMIVHDIKIPLGMSRSIIDTYRRNPTLAISLLESPKSSESYINALDYADGLVKDLLSYKSSDKELKKESFDLKLFISNFEERSQIEIEKKFDYGMIPISGEINLLMRLFNNLLENAIRATPRGERVEILCSVDSSGHKVRINNKSDKIDEIDFDQFFMPFYSFNKKSGTGLGTTIAKHVVDLHGGNIEVEVLEQDKISVSVFLPRR